MTEPFRGPPYTWGSGSVPGWCEMFMDAALKEYGMTETKTFKHPLGLTSAFEDINRLMRTAQTPKYEIYTEDSGYEEFPLAEWDIEVTFTKKVKAVAVGDVVRHHNWPVWYGSEVPIYFVVKAVIGDQAWLGYKDRSREDMLASLSQLYFDDAV